eukprot:7278291-Pyramimonas_sp.AAC.1
MVSVGHIQSSYIHAPIAQGKNHLLGRGAWSDGAHRLCLSGVVRRSLCCGQVLFKFCGHPVRRARQVCLHLQVLVPTSRKPSTCVATIGVGQRLEFFMLTRGCLESARLVECVRRTRISSQSASKSNQRAIRLRNMYDVCAGF